MALVLSSSTSIGKPRHNVFLSFRGKDTRYGLVSHLDRALQYKGIGVYLDSKDLPRGEQISPALLTAIEESMIAAIVFSENYATSRWCLEEVSHIMQCSRSRKPQLLVVPIFYKVDPSFVRKQTGSFENAFIEHERERPGEVQRWRKALTDAGNLCGFHITGDRPEIEVIDEIVQDIISKLSGRISQSDYKGLVGIGPKVEQIISLLRIGEEGVRMIGIWGMGGVGKTTLAKAVFDKISSQFESGCLVLHVRDHMSDNRGAINLRNELVSTLLKENANPGLVITPAIGSSFVKDRLSLKRVLVVLDDVSDFKQIEKLEISYNHLGSGSRVIVTSRDKQVLLNSGESDDEVYEVEILNPSESLELFSQHAFKQNHPIDGFWDLSDEFLGYARGLPLALKILGITLYKKSKVYWESALKKLKNHPDPEIFNVLKISFDELDDVEKNVFLDIACFLDIHDKVVELESKLAICYDGMFDSAKDNLANKCLLSKDDLYEYRMHYWMHDLVREMGRKIVCQESDNPGKRSRLCDLKDVRRVLKENMGTESIKTIYLYVSETDNTIEICPSAFEKMVNLEFISFEAMDYKFILQDQYLTRLPDTLKYFEWNYCPLKSLPLNFCPTNLVELQLFCSDIEQLWDENDQNVVNLRVMELRYCKNLRKIPNLLGATKLESLNCEGCKNLAELPCMTHLTSLTRLNLSYSTLITKFPEIPTNGVLEELWLSGTQIEEVPSFVGSLKKLKHLFLDDCPNLRELNLNMMMTPIEEEEQVPTSSISLLRQSLCLLIVTNCTSLRSLLGLPASLTHLDVGNCASLEQVSFLDLDEDHYDNRAFCMYDFLGCFKLSQDARNNIIAVDPRISSQYIAKQLAMNEPWRFRSYNRLHLHGSEIPDMFENQSRNSSITVKLLGSATTTTSRRRLLCFVLCLVLNFDYIPQLRKFDFICEYQLKGTDDGQNFKGTRTIPQFWSNPTRVGCSSGDLFFIFEEDMIQEDKNYMEASFDFHAVSHYAYYNEQGIIEKKEKRQLKVEKCGVHVFYVDAENFTVSHVGSGGIINCGSVDEDDRLSLAQPSSLLGGLMVEDDENDHDDPASKLALKRRILDSTDDEGDHPHKRLKRLYSSS